MIYPWQQTQWQQVAQLLDRQRLPHALLLHGNSGLGKLAFARELANAVLCQQPDDAHHACGRCPACHLVTAQTHPDLHFLEPSASTNSRSKNPVLSIRIEEIRQLCEKLNQTSQFDGYRVAIIEQADKMTVPAANSLLKTLEEPGDNVLIIIQTSRPQRLPVTIRSRCQQVRFSVPDEATALAWLKTQQSDHSEKSMLHALRYCYGSPLKVLAQLDAPEHLKLLGDAMTATVSGKNVLDYATELARYDKVQTLEGMLSWTSDLMKAQACGSDATFVNALHTKALLVMAGRADKQRLFKFHEQLNFNLSHGAIAVNEQLLWENLLLSWSNL